jgi:hypothetical protein
VVYAMCHLRKYFAMNHPANGLSQSSLSLTGSHGASSVSAAGLNRRNPNDLLPRTHSSTGKSQATCATQTCHAESRRLVHCHSSRAIQHRIQLTGEIMSDPFMDTSRFKLEREFVHYTTSPECSKCSKLVSEENLFLGMCETCFEDHMANLEEEEMETPKIIASMS